MVNVPISSDEQAEGLRRAEAFLAARFGSDVGSVRLIGNGAWSRAYAFRRGASEYVVRFSAFEEDFAKDRLASTFDSPALPIPRVVELGESDGGFYAISEYVVGRPLDALSAAELRELLPSLFAALDAMRQADVSCSAGFGLWHADGNADSTSWHAWLLSVQEDTPTLRTHGWRARLAQSATGAEPFATGLRAMAALVPHVPAARHLIHSDLLNNNVLVAGARIAGLLDWGSALYGDFLYDIAWLSFCRPLWYPAWRGIDIAIEARRHYAAIGLEVPDFAARLRCYELHIGLGSQAYCAYMGRSDDLALVARHTLALARAPLIE